jgi:hypothetical protein
MSNQRDPSGFLEMLEKNYGVEKCWEWVQDWIWEEPLLDSDERCSLEEYLALRAGNDDEDKDEYKDKA